jgi:site-specific recombinase XerC
MKPLSVQALETIGKEWDKGKGTREAHLRETKAFANFVQERFALEKLQNLKTAHVESYVAHLQERGLARGTICNHMTAVRNLAEAIGKRNIVARDNVSYGVNRVSRQNPVVQNTAKVNEIRAEIAARANAGDRIAMMCHAAAELRDAFGLRAEESLMSSKLVGAIQSLLVEGAKGGRLRELPPMNEIQAHAAVQIALVSKALGSATGRIMPPELTLKQAYNAQRTLWRELGGTRANGAHMHAARHAEAQRMHKEGVPHSEIMERMGHSGGRSPFCYIPK